MKINDFRQFKDIQTLNFNDYMNIFTGKNMTGKSTLLAMIAQSANSSEKDSLGTKCKASYKEIIKVDIRFDKKTNNAYRVLTSKHNNEISIIRTYYNVNRPTNEGYRILPEQFPLKDNFIKENKNGKLLFEVPVIDLLTCDRSYFKTATSSKKNDMPVIYLGLSRLYPIGEITMKNLDLPDFNDDEINIYKQWRFKIIGQESIKNIKALKQIAIKKTTLSHEAEHHGEHNISAGQDNLSQILCAILKFKKLKQKGNAGGILLIDEFDATLHHRAQEKLINLLIEQAKYNEFQVFITTHNPLVSRMVINELRDDYGNIIESKKYFHFERDSSTYQVSITEGLDKDDIGGLLIEKPVLHKVMCISEDNEARWLFKQLFLSDKTYNIEFIESQIGCTEMAKIQEVMDFFLYILDGDAVLTEKGKKRNNYIQLPSHIWTEDELNNFKGYKDETLANPECFLYGYIYNIYKNNQDHKIINSITSDNKTKDDILGVNNFYVKSRDSIKDWFKNNKELFEKIDLVGSWKLDNPDEFKELERKLRLAYDNVASNFTGLVNKNL